jgi:hypothetical protein
MSQMSRAYLIGKSADKIFKKHKIDPSLASLSALELQTFSPEEFSDQMIIHRVVQQRTRSELARRIGCDYKSLELWEHKQFSPKLIMMQNWAEALNLELSLRLSSRP